MDWYFGDIGLVRLIFQRGLAGIYLIAFLVVLRQFKPLLGERGLLPVPDYVRYASFRRTPSLFHWRYSDRLLDIVAWMGIILSAAALLGLSEAGPWWLSVSVWLVLWGLYLSVVNVGQIFYGFGWESMLLEAGFFAAFLGPTPMAPSLIPMLALRWMLFRTELGAGLIKLRHDRCWRDLTCLFYHYETQPLPNPLSWYFHQLPKLSHRVGVLGSHVVQLIVPFGLFAPQPVASIAGSLLIAHQLWLIISGNYSWLNWLTVVLGVSAFSDSVITSVLPFALSGGIPRPGFFEGLIYLIGVATVLLSIQPVLNLFSRNQLMNYSYNGLHLVNTYGAFGSVTKERYEIVLEGTRDSVPAQQTAWQEYGFKAKPGDPARTPPQVAPYHLRLDWLMWFLPFGVHVTATGIAPPRYERWFLIFVKKLLENDAATLRLLKHNPFEGEPPVFIRALFYHYEYVTAPERRETGAVWKRRLVDAYLRPVCLTDFRESETRYMRPA
jgi:hypothetical protein